MQKRHLIGAALALPCLLLTRGVCAQTQRSAVLCLENFVRKTRSAKGRFTQRVIDKDGASRDAASTGTFAFLRPGKFYWVTEKPYPQTMMSDGKTLWLYEPDLSQVTVRSLAGQVSATPATVLFGTGDLASVFSLSEDGEDGDILWVKALPKKEDISFSEIRIGFDGQGALSRMTLRDHFGQRVELTFSDIQSGTSLILSDFVFRIPEGAEVLSSGNELL